MGAIGKQERKRIERERRTALQASGRTLQDLADSVRPPVSIQFAQMWVKALRTSQRLERGFQRITKPVVRAA